MSVCNMLPDKFSKETRSKIMSSIKGKNTQPEMAIRKILWSKGKRYRIHDVTVIGTPDILIKRQNLAVFLDGCFWHGCRRCYKEPKTNSEFWRNKIARNKNRRKIVKAHLKKDGWKVLEFWEHQIHDDPNAVVEKIINS